MSGPALFERKHFEHNDVVAWLILGYLCCHPDAKDTADGVEKWWLNGVEASTNATTVRNSLDYLVRSGWLVASERQGTGTVYGLNKNRQETLQQFLQRTEDLR